MQVKRRALRQLGRSSMLVLPLALVAVAGFQLTQPKESNADLEAPQASDRQVTLVVGSLLRSEHLTEHALDDEISQRAFDIFLRQLDPMKLYFLQSDVDEFRENRGEIDDDIRAGDIVFAYEVFHRFMERMEERVEVIDELLALSHDFTLDEEIITDPDLLDYPTNSEEARERWRLRVKYDLLVLKSDETEGEEAIERLTRRYHSFARRMEQYDSDELLEMYLTAFTMSFDPHTTYMSPSTLENFNISMRLQLDGIGAALQMVDGYTVISKVIPGGAADQEGSLEAEDRVVSVGQGEDGVMVDVIDMKLGDVVGMIRGRAGTIVRLGVVPGGVGDTQEYSIVRARIALSDSEAQGEVIEEGTKADGSPFRMGVIDLPSFYMDMAGARAGQEDFKSTTRDVQAILEDFDQQNVDLVILDLRRNGGGSLTESINLTGLFIDTGPVVQVKDSANRIQHYDDVDRGMAWEGPLVVLTSRFSASASEILAGAIQDYHRGLVLGDESTHGKGTVQSLLDLGQQLFRIQAPPNLGALKITMQQFYRPNGDSTQLRGVLADVVLPSMSQHIQGISESDLDYAVEFDQVPAADFTAYPLVNDTLIAQLRERSQARVGESEEFSDLSRRIDRYQEQKERSTVTLNEEAFLAERSQLNAEREERLQFEEAQNGHDGEGVVRRDYYFNEVMAVAADYARLLRDAEIAQAN